MTKKKRKEEERPDEARDAGEGALAGTSGAAEQDVDAQTAGARDELDELNGKWLRALADLDNYRKRVERDRRRWSEAAREVIILDLLEVVDNFERALAHDDSTGHSRGGSLREGVELILKHLTDILRKHGVTPIDTRACEFDPNIHEAVGHVESSEHDPDHIIEETQRGYLLGEKLLRCSKVIVSK
jgi:molecular chaperone GrpE